MIEAEELTHHQQTLRLWEAMGTEVAHSEYGGQERRRRVRLLTPESACRLDVITGNQQQELPVTIRDVCINGACVMGDVAVPVGEMARLHPAAVTGSPLDPVEGRVVSCRWRSGRYRVGVQFQP